MTRICAQLLAALLASTLIAPTCFGGPVYRVVDAQGNITYTDAPEAGKRKEEIEVPRINLQPALTPTPNPTPAPADAIKYQAKILSPANDSTIPPGQLSVAVAVELKPALQQGHRVRVMLDGKAQGKPSTRTAFQLSKLVRGTHQLLRRWLTPITRSLPPPRWWRSMSNATPSTIPTRYRHQYLPRRNRDRTVSVRLIRASARLASSHSTTPGHPVIGPLIALQQMCFIF